MTTNSPLVIPSAFAMATSEIYNLGFDFTAYIAVGDSISSPSSQLIDLTSPDPTVITLGTTPTVDGNIISQVVTGSQLVATHIYRLTMTCTLNTSKVTAAALQINVPF